MSFFGPTSRSDWGANGEMFRTRREIENSRNGIRLENGMGEQEEQENEMCADPSLEIESISDDVKHL